MNNTLLYAITVLIWGSTWLAIEFQLGVVAPEVSVAYRYLLAAALLFGWCSLRGKSLFGFDRRQHGTFLALGLLLFCLNYIAAYYAQLYITSALNAICFACIVWMNILNARIFFGIKSEFRVMLGAGLGIVGVFILFWPQIEDISFGGCNHVGGGH